MKKIPIYMYQEPKLDHMYVTYNGWICLEYSISPTS